MNTESILQKFNNELKKAESKHPDWPEDIIHQVAIIVEEIGEMMQAALDFNYNKSKSNNYFELKQKLQIENEAIQVGAMALRFLKNFYQSDN